MDNEFAVKLCSLQLLVRTFMNAEEKVEAEGEGEEVGTKRCLTSS
jgi:hypothetical protein